VAVTLLVGGKIRRIIRANKSETMAGFSEKQSNALLKTMTCCALRTSIHKPEGSAATRTPNGRGDKGRRTRSQFLGWLFQAAVSAPAD
jgi:hypothetical protein